MSNRRNRSIYLFFGWGERLYLDDHTITAVYTEGTPNNCGDFFFFDDVDSFVITAPLMVFFDSGRHHCCAWQQAKLMVFFYSVTAHGVLPSQAVRTKRRTQNNKGSNSTNGAFRKLGGEKKKPLLLILPQPQHSTLPCACTFNIYNNKRKQHTMGSPLSTLP